MFNRVLVALFLCLFIGQSRAADSALSFDFNNVSMVVFSEAVFKVILKRDYVVSSDVLHSDKKITVQIRSIPYDGVLPFVDNLLSQQGLSLTLLDDVFYIDFQKSLPRNSVDALPSVSASPLTSPSDSVLPEKVRDSFVYIPQNRTPEVMVDLLNFAFPKSSFLSGDRLLISGSAEVLQKVKVFLLQLDTLPKSVEVSAAWVEVTDTTGSNLGISAALNLLGGKFGGALGATTSSSLSFTGLNFQLVLDALNSDSRFHQVSSSRVLGDDRQKVNFTVGQETPTISSTSTNTAGNPVQNIVYKDSGVIIEVTPRCLPSGKININLDGQISAFAATTTGVSGSPTLTKRELKTVVTISDGDVLVIGGLKSSESTKTNQGLFFLPSSWGTHNDSTSKSDLVLILSARVVVVPDKAFLPHVD